jgi:hypothetical protein
MALAGPPRPLLVLKLRRSPYAALRRVTEATIDGVMYPFALDFIPAAVYILRYVNIIPFHRCSTPSDVSVCTQTGAFS